MTGTKPRMVVCIIEYVDEVFMTLLNRLAEQLRQRKIKDTDPIWLRSKGCHIGVYGFSTVDKKIKWVTWVSKSDAELLKDSGVDFLE